MSSTSAGAETHREPRIVRTRGGIAARMVVNDYQAGRARCETRGQKHVRNRCCCARNSIVCTDRLSDAIPEELWNSKSAALQDELRQVRTEMERYEVASQAYETAGLQILELAQTAYSSYVAKNPHEQARLIKTLVSNSTFDRGSLSPTYVKPFDVFAKGSERKLAPQAGFEPATLRLTAGCSAVELLRNIGAAGTPYCSASSGTRSTKPAITSVRPLSARKPTEAARLPGADIPSVARGDG
jgi:hypothetical protein